MTAAPSVATTPGSGTDPSRPAPSPPGGAAGSSPVALFRRHPVAGAGVVVVVVAGVVLRFVAASALWLDEALTVNIASLPLSDLVEALRRDGAPPLYYAVLHGWMRLFGAGDVAARSLSGVFAVAALPLAWVAGAHVERRILRWRPTVPAGAIPATALVLLAANPYAVRFATEARMYAMVMFLVLAGHVVLGRALERPTLPRLMVVAIVSGLLLLTQYWAIWLLGAVVAVLGVAWWRTRRRPLVEPTGATDGSAYWRAGLAVAAGGLLFVPWLPAFLWQLSHTGTPWGTAPNPVSAGFATLTDFGGGLGPVARLVTMALLGLTLLGLAGRAVDRVRFEIDLRTVPGARAEAAVAAAALGVGLVAGLVTNAAFQPRYAAVVFPLLLLTAAAGVRALAAPRVRAGVVGAVAAASLVVAGELAVTSHKTQARQVVAAIEQHGGRPGDVVAYCPDQVAPSVHRLLPAGYQEMVFATDPGEGLAPGIVDWVDYAARHEAADPQEFAAEVVAAAGDRPVWYVWMGGYRTLDKRCEAVNDALAAASVESRLVVDNDPAYFERHNLTLHRPR